MEKTLPKSHEDVLLSTELAKPLPTGSSDLEQEDALVFKLRALWEKRRFLARATLAGLVLSAILAFTLPKRYEATVRLMPPDSQPNNNLALLAAISGRAGGVGALASDLLGLKSSGSLFVGILRSQTVQDRLIQNFGLKKVYGKKLTEDAQEKLSDNSFISEDRKSGIVTIVVTDESPERARSMANAYVGELNRLVAELTTSSAHRERVFLEERLKVVKEELDSAAVEFSQFASKNTTIDIKEQGRAMVEAAATLAGHLIAAQTELEGLRQIYSDNNVRVRASQARIAELKRQLKKLGGDAPDAPPDLANGEESIYPSIRKLPILGVTYANLYRRTKINEVIYELLTQQYELAKVQEVKEIPTVKVLDEGRLPEKKTFPPRLLIMVLGSFFSFAFGAVWVLSRVRWEQIHPQAPVKAFAIEVWSTVQVSAMNLSRNGHNLRRLPRNLLERLRLRRGSGTTDQKSK